MPLTSRSRAAASPPPIGRARGSTGGVRFAPGWSLGDRTATIHPLVGYTYPSFDGGHDSLWELGVQLRTTTSRLGDRGAWLGGEVGFAHLSTVIDESGGSTSEGFNSFMIGGFAGVPVSDNEWNPSVFAGAGLTRFGGSNGINLRVGVDVQPPFLNR